MRDNAVHNQWQALKNLRPNCINVTFSHQTLIMDFYIGVHSDCANCPTTGNFSCRLNREINLGDDRYKVAIASVSRYHQSNEITNDRVQNALGVHSSYGISNAAYQEFPHPNPMYAEWTTYVAETPN